MLIGLLFAAFFIGILVGVLTFHLEYVKAKKGALYLLAPPVVIFLIHLFSPEFVDVFYASMAFSGSIFLTWCYLDKNDKDE